MLKKITKLFTAIAVITVFSAVFSSNKAEAATIPVASGTDTVAVDSSCSLSEAIGNINDQATTNADCVAGDGIDDTITLPSGTITLTADLPTITESLIVSGAGKTSTTIDADGNEGFYVNAISGDVTFEDFKIKDTDATSCEGGIYVFTAIDITLNSIESENDCSGIELVGLHVSVSDVNVHNATSIDGKHSGIKISLFATNILDEPTVSVIDSEVSNVNASDSTAGLDVTILNNDSTLTSISIERTLVSNNTSNEMSGIRLETLTSTPTDLALSAVTISNNTTENNIVGGANPFDQPIISGLFISIQNLIEGQNVINVTVANNTAINETDDHVTIAGFFALSFSAANKYSLLNSTVVGNSATATQESVLVTSPSFFLANVIFDEFGAPTAAETGGSAINTLVADNSFNGVSSSCRNDLDMGFIGLLGTFDASPLDLGNNIIDNPDCTGYTVAPNILSTLGPLQDNGGPVPTIALLPGSPAIGAGGAVLGISTDARGIPRPSTPDVGAYQTVLGDTTTTIGPASSGGVGVPNSGFAPKESSTSKATIVFIVLSSIALVNILIKRLKNA